MDAMKIAQICPFDPFYVIGGMETYVRQLSIELKKRDHEVYILTSNKTRVGEIRRKKETVDGIHIYRYPTWFSLGEFATFWPTFAKQMRKMKFDVVHTHAYRHPHSDISLIICKLTKTASIMNPWLPGYPIRPLHQKVAVAIHDMTIGKLSLNLATFIVASNKLEATWLKNLGIKSSKICLINPGIPSDMIVPQDGQDFRRAYGLSGPIVLYVGRSHPSKGLDHLILAAKGVIDQLPNANFVIFGDRSPYELTLRNLAEKLGISDHVKILGQEAQVFKKQIYGACNVFVLPSSFEGFGLVILEAFAQKKPVVATKRGAIPYIVEEGKDGILVSWANTSELAEAIVKLLSDEKLGKTMGEMGYQKVMKEYLWNQAIEKIENLYARAQSMIDET